MYAYYNNKYEHIIGIARGHTCEQTTASAKCKFAENLNDGEKFRIN